MQTVRIAELLGPFAAGPQPSPLLLGHLQQYLELLLRWNARINLTAVRDPEQVVTRHFGESLFAAHVLLGGRAGASESRSLADVGSGAGFPGIPIKLFAPELELTLVESHNKKATFLREVIRTLGLEGAHVFGGRAERWGKTADVVTLRAVEQFNRVLPTAAEMVTAGGKLCLLISAGQVSEAQKALGPGWTWQEPNAVPQSTSRVVLVGSRL